MNKITLITFSVCILLLVSANKTFSQFNDYSVKGGIQISGLLPDTDFEELKFKNYKPSFMGRALLRLNLIDLFDVEFGAGYGILAGVDDRNLDYWESSIIPLDLRFMFSPFNSKSINPYIYGGGGYLFWSLDDPPIPQRSPAPTKSSGNNFFIPFGAGFEIALSNSVILDFSGGLNYVFSDDLNGFNNIDSPSGGENDTYWNLGVGLIFYGHGGSSDFDNDGLIKKMEEEIGTDPDNPDTDGDGINDGLEFYQYLTNPLKVDSDADGLTDYEEISIHATNPNLVDTDQDGFPDGDEINIYKINPLRTDSDFDGLSDSEEINIHKTDPNKTDSDNDGLKDGDEINRYKTSPLLQDTDEDGLSDYDEIFKYNTNPLLKDTDGGTTDDKEEIIRGTNPLNPADDIILDVEAPIILDGVTFETGSATLTPESEKILLQVLNTLNAYPFMNIEIRGYTDNVGKPANNLNLSQRRANSVKYWLASKGITPGRIIAIGYGSQNPIADNSTPEGRRLNRRIEFRKIN